jgi:hypothetical protein
MQEGYKFCETCNLNYFKECHCCEAVHDHVSSIDLEGGWVLNHYEGHGKYLGRLVLQTKCHHQNWGDISDDKVTFLGVNIKLINKWLLQYFQDTYKDDIEQVYVVYFNDAPYKTKNPNPDELRMNLHVHMHLLTRTKKMRETMKCANFGEIGRLFGMKTAGCSGKSATPWAAPD